MWHASNGRWTVAGNTVGLQLDNSECSAAPGLQGTNNACLLLLVLCRWMAADLYLREVDVLRFEVSLCGGAGESAAAVHIGATEIPHRTP